ncbi:hypothetical protein JHK87_016230 [Glycine soja]|nr:hypothetical protein JHK87_016230 [Glycine soja]
MHALDLSDNVLHTTSSSMPCAELAVSDFFGNGDGILSAATTVASTFLLVFVVEWGDKSFFSTIALPPASSPLRVIAGVVAGHGVATLLPVLGGSLLGMYLPEKNLAHGALHKYLMT